ncbi:MAG: biotin/lipoyl-containing protein, partial [Chloroflexota bacterium]
MAAPVELPKVGDSAFEGIVGRWLKQVGDEVEEFEPLLEIESDKATVEMPSPAGGVLSKILVPEGQKVPVGTVIALIGTSVEDAAFQPPGTPVAQTPGGVPPPPLASGQAAGEGVAPTPSQPGAKASPLAARLAFKSGLDINVVKSTGGRVSVDDVKRHLAAAETGTAERVSPDAGRGTPDARRGTPDAVPGTSESGPGT